MVPKTQNIPYSWHLGHYQQKVESLLKVAFLTPNILIHPFGSRLFVIFNVFIVLPEILMIQMKKQIFQECDSFPV